jgi:hypothetical protein
MSEKLYYVARNKGAMKSFDTESEAYSFAEDHSSIALYSTTDGKNLTFVKVVGLKTSTEVLATIMSGGKAA